MGQQKPLRTDLHSQTQPHCANSDIWGAISLKMTLGGLEKCGVLLTHTHGVQRALADSDCPLLTYAQPILICNTQDTHTHTHVSKQKYVCAQHKTLTSD